MNSRVCSSLVALGLGLGIVSSATSAHADDAPAAASAVSDRMLAYYGGEKTTAFVFIAVGAGSAAAGGVALTQKGDFAHGLGASLLTLGALEAIGAAFYAVQVGAEIDHYSEALAKDPTAFKKEELAHIHGTNSRFFWYRASELALAAGGVGVATYGFAKGQDVMKGIGIGVAAEAITFFALDSFGAARAHAYEDEVRRFEPQVSLGSGQQPTTVGVRGTF